MKNRSKNWPNCKMISSRSIKISLTCLLGVVALCLVMFEVRLNRHLTFLKVAVEQGEVVHNTLVQVLLGNNGSPTAGSLQQRGMENSDIVSQPSSSVVANVDVWTDAKNVSAPQAQNNNSKVADTPNSDIHPFSSNLPSTLKSGGQIEAEGSPTHDSSGQTEAGRSSTQQTESKGPPAQESGRQTETKVVSPAEIVRRYTKPLSGTQPSSNGTKTSSTGISSSSVPNESASVLEQNATHNAKLVFEKNAQVQAGTNGTRPTECGNCFNTDFTVLVENPDTCKLTSDIQHIDLIMLILTTHKALERRMAIRQTWASVTKNNTAHIRHVFLLGRSAGGQEMQTIREEHRRFNDIVVHDFVDSYTNLTLKTMSGFRWAVSRCGNVRFLLKVDDDMWVNIPDLLNQLKQEDEEMQTAVAGACHKKAHPIRNKNSKWYASPRAYPQSDYPGFCSGTAYVTSLNVARHVISISPNVPFFYLEDVYLALCIQKLGGKFHLKPMRGFYAWGKSRCHFKSPAVFTTHQVSPTVLREIWKANCTIT